MITIEDIKTDKHLLQEFIEFFFEFKPYKYQLRFLHKCFEKNRIAAKWPRQSGKSQTVSVYVAIRILLEPLSILITSPTQTQSDELYLKVRTLIENNETFKQQLTKITETEMRFKNGGRIKSLPSGPDGKSIRGHTADIVIIEEAGIMKDTIVNTIIVPMLASKKDKGQIIKIGTPLTKNHFYKSCFIDPNYEVISISWKEVVEAGQYSINFINEQKENLLDIEFQTEYEALFISDEYAFFPSELIEGCSYTYTLLSVV
jgi:hypothetical protein